MLYRFKTTVVVIPLAAALAMSGCGRRKHAAAHVPQPPSGPEVGLASWYGHPYHGRAAADGEIYDMEKLTAAHRTLPFNTWVRVTNLSNGKTVDVRIIDRGPFIDGRIIDLSHAAAQAIDLIGPGVARVQLDIIAAPAAAATQQLYTVQIGAFQDRDRAERLRNSMEEQFGFAKLVLRQGRPNVWRVLVGEASNMDDAKFLAGRIRTEVGEALVVRLDTPATQ